MPCYTINGLNHIGVVVSAIRTEAQDDDAAIRWAAVRFRGGLFEIWQPGRLVWPNAQPPCDVGRLPEPRNRDRSAPPARVRGTVRIRA